MPLKNGDVKLAVRTDLRCVMKEFDSVPHHPFKKSIAVISFVHVHDVSLVQKRPRWRLVLTSRVRHFEQGLQFEDDGTEQILS